MIRFDSKTQIIINDELAKTISSLITEEKAKNIGMIIDENIAAHAHIKELIECIEKKAELFTQVIKSYEPTTDAVNKFSAWYRNKKIDIFIGIGGGSTLDLTKAVSAMVLHPGTVEEYHGTGKVLQGAVKKIMIPTTAGTGAEVTPGAVLVNEKTKFKRGLGGRCISSDYAVLDPALTISMPDHVTAATGMDALGHAIESYTARNANDITRMYSKEAFRLIFHNLQKVFDDKENLEIRKNILLGSCLAGYAIYNSNTGACHSIAYPLGVYHKVPHGVAVALILPKVVRINVEKDYYQYSDLYDLINKSNAKNLQNTSAKAHKFCDLLEKYTPAKYLKTRLTDYGINESNYRFIAERGLDLTPALNNNPVDFTLEDSLRVIKSLI